MTGGWLICTGPFCMAGASAPHDSWWLAHVGGRLAGEEDASGADPELSLRDWQPPGPPTQSSQPVELSLRDWGAAPAAPPSQPASEALPPHQVCLLTCSTAHQEHQSGRLLH